MSLDTIANNIIMAEDNVSPICQDTGLPTFKIYTPVGVNQLEIKAAIKKQSTIQLQMLNYVRMQWIHYLVQTVVIILVMVCQ